MWSIAGVPFGVSGRTNVWVNFPQSNADNDAAAKLLHPEVGMYVALGGGANHLSEAVSRLNHVSSIGGAADSADGGNSAPGALRGYHSLLPAASASTSDSSGGAKRRPAAAKNRKPAKKGR